MDNHLNAYQCKECGRRSLIAQGYCFSCRCRDSYHLISIKGKGTIFSFTKIHVAEERFQEETPYVLAVIDCEGGLRLMARIIRKDSEQVLIGSEVEFFEWKEEVPIFKVS